MNFSPLSAAAAAALLALAATPATQAQSLTIGSGNVAVADPVVPRPPGTPCVVTLYANEQFPPDLSRPNFNGSLHPYTFTPPANCPGPWEKVVLSADFSETAGRQFDRTAVVWLGGAVIYFGTTQEPSATVAPSWHVERDLTDYSALFQKTQDGYIQLANWYDPNGVQTGLDLTGVYQSSAKLYFYRGGLGNQGERADQVLPLQPNTTVSVANSTDQLAATLTLPTNIERAFLDVYLQSQSSDEFWFFDVPDQNVANTFGDPFASPFKEGEVTIDGQPAGIVPVYPWIFTGGADPLLWRPIPGVQTLAFEPYRVDLTPFVGLLNDGAAHSVAVSVFNTIDHFSTAANLLLYQDHGSSHVTGVVTANTLQPSPVVSTVDNVSSATDGSLSGPISVTSGRHFTITGTANTSHGMVTTRIDTQMAFSNVQQFTYVAATGTNTQDLVQNTSIDTTTTRSMTGAPTVVAHEVRNYPLTFHYDVPVFPDGSFDLRTFADQELKQRVDISANGATKTAQLDNHRIATATRHPYPAAGTPTTSSQTYTYSDPFGACYSRAITAERDSVTLPGVLTGVTDGAGCPGGVNTLGWHDQFADFASRLLGATEKLLP